MPNFLEDFGRSGAAESLQRVSGVAVELGKLNLAASQQRVNAAINLQALDLREQGMELDRMKTKSELDLREQQIRKAKYEADELKKKQDWLGSRTNPRLNPIFMGLPQESQDNLMKYLESQGMLDKEGSASRRNQLDVLHELNTNTQFFDQSLRMPIIRDAEKKIVEAETAYQNEKAKGAKANPEKLSQLQADRKVAQAHYNQAKGNMDKTLEAVQAEENYQNQLGLIRERGRNAIAAAKARGGNIDNVQKNIENAMKGEASARRAIAQLKAGGGLDDILAKMYPNVASSLKSGDTTAVEDAIKSFERLAEMYAGQVATYTGGKYQEEEAQRSKTREEEVLEEIKKIYEEGPE